MDVTISGRNVDVNDDVKDAVRSKIGSLDRFVSGLDRAAVVFREEKNPRIAEREQLEATLEGHGHHIRCKVSGVDQMQAVDLAVVKLEKQLRKLKTRVVKRHRPNSHRNDNHRPLAKSAVVEREPVEDDPLEDIPAAELVAPEIAKRKSFELMEMTPEAAATRMQLLDHSFFLFRNAETGRSAVVYMRDDHSLGVIDEG
ncbi:MAG: ribosome-associated translation inhibitor RaiA [Actinomycetia bacterium]|nr:ribosome-associated translation inhibitor RaiA [Actinomycetes bacterium]MCP4957844.1 ribosome-associated translation inhibitor RaiA [Actinomycetes bacterium]